MAKRDWISEYPFVTVRNGSRLHMGVLYFKKPGLTVLINSVRPKAVNFGPVMFKVTKILQQETEIFIIPSDNIEAVYKEEELQP